MRTLTKEAERKLIGAIEKAAALVNDGMSPDEAIIKSAGESNIPAGHINLMVHAYNTGRTTKQRENGESTLEKAAEFAMADADKVLKALYPEQVKTSAEIAIESVVSTEYAISAAGMLARRKDAMRKVAAAQVTLPVVGYERPPRDEHAAVMRAHSEKMAAVRVEEEKRRAATVAYAKAASAMDDLNTYFRTPGNMSFGDALREVNLRLGPSGVSVLEKVAAVYPHFTKQADTNKNYFGDNPLYGLVQTVLDSVGAYNDAQAQVSVKKSEAVSEKTAPQFLTGSILAEEAPLTLKEAARSRKGGPGTSPLAGYGGLPTPSEKPLVFSAQIPPQDNLERRVDQLVNTGLELTDDATASKNVQDDATGTWIEQQRPYWREAIEQAQKNKQQRDDENYARVQREHDTAAERKQDESFQSRLTNIKARKHWRDERDKKREEDQKYWQGQGKSIGEGIGKTFKGDFLGNAKAPMQFVAEGLGAKNLGEMTGLAKKDTGKIMREEYQRLVDPSHENALKTIRAKSVLHDMILNDPVVSGYDPQDVAMAFNEIAELAPSLVDTPGVIRPLLRKRLEAGQMADFDVKQILEMEKLRGDRDKTLLDLKEKNLSLL